MVKGAQVYTFSQLAKKIAGTKGGVLKLGYETTANFLSSTQIGIKLFNTYVVIVRSDGKYQLNTGGYTTATTKDRLNGFSPAKIVQKDFGFFILADPRGKATKDNLIPYYDGIIVDRSGKVVA